MGSQTRSSPSHHLYSRLYVVLRLRNVTWWFVIGLWVFLFLGVKKVDKAKTKKIKTPHALEFLYNCIILVPVLPSLRTFLPLLITIGPEYSPCTPF